jgi:hypothetical protein
MRVPWLTVVLLALGACRAARAQAPVPCPSTTPVAAFPDIVPGAKTTASKDPVAELLDGDPYADALAAIHLRTSRYDPAVDGEDPYAEQLRLMNPYTEELHVRPRAAAPTTTELLDIETNPYTRR